MRTRFDLGEKSSNIVYIRAIAVADLPEEVRAQIPEADEIYSVHNSEGERLALVPSRRMAFELARENDLAPVNVH